LSRYRFDDGGRLAQKEIRVSRAKTLSKVVLRQSLQKVATVRHVSSFPMMISCTARHATPCVVTTPLSTDYRIHLMV
jgi:hypothetical protein